MKRIFMFLLIFSIFFKSNIFASDVLNESDIVSQAAILMDYKTGRVLWGKNIHEPLPMASTTKIMTAILAIESGKLDDIVTVSKKAASAPRVKMFLSVNEKIKLEYLIYALMLQSSNDAAVAIAEHISGTVDEFCNLMTKRAKQIAAKDTVFKTPNGLDSADHHSTAYDMALISKYALSNDTFVKIINTKNISFKSNFKNYNIINKNRLLSEFNGANGIKTGYTGKAGHCFVGSATRNGQTLISVVLASGWGNKGKQQKWIDTKKLLNYGFNNYKEQKIFEKGELTESVNIKKGTKDKVFLDYETSLYLPLKFDEKKELKIVYDYKKDVDAPIYKNQKLGVANVYIKNDVIASINLIAKDDVYKNDFKTYFKKIINNWVNISI